MGDNRASAYLRQAAQLIMEKPTMKEISTLKTLIDGLKVGLQRERAETQMTLGKMIATLKDMHSFDRIEGLYEPHSYRGYYEDLAFEPIKGATSEPLYICASELLDLCMSAMGKAYQGYKGGTFVMYEMTPVWVAHYGQVGKRLIAINRDGTIETAEEEE